jgi:kinesin family protein 20
VVELDDKAVKQEILYKQQIMAWSQYTSNVFDSKISGTNSEKAPDNTTSSIKSQAISDSYRDMQEQLNNSLLVNTDGKGSAFSPWVSFAEIYNENVYDLLEPIGSGRQKRQNLALAVYNKGQVYVKGLTHICVNSAEEAYHIMLYGQHSLRMAATGLNGLPSRSHCIFTIKLLQHLETEHQKSVRISAFSFCDLAGAESAKKTHNVGERLKESQNINTSLLVLGRCLMAIRDNQMNKSENLVPFRD